MSLNILDVGSRVVKAGAYSYKMSVEPLGLNYVGLDLEAGNNVQIVPRNPYIWEEIENSSFNFAVSGQAFEHNPFMWITICEIARILKEGGSALIIAPSAGPVHRWPYDCWRYYPDSWAALASLSGLELAETIREPKDRFKAVPGGKWLDAAAVFRKPMFNDRNVRQLYYKNLAEITAPFVARQYEVVPAIVNEGPCFQHYLQSIERFGKNPPAKQRPIAKRTAARRRQQRLAAQQS